MTHPSGDSGSVLAGNVLVTGGTGFVGRALLRRADRERWPVQVVITSRSAENLARVRERFPGVRGLLADLTRPEGAEALRRALEEERIDTVIHAAAVKSVPDAERDVRVAIELNVTGSERVARAAIAREVGFSDQSHFSRTFKRSTGMTPAAFRDLFSEN